ncbi:hypothetical protein [Methanobacterium sp. MBAC-LM]|uniref:hypothetical protein n=1 Tax=Methanobacterium sp. MBAC-LM TaxID=3412034 RepID=UPI003C72582D
MERNEDSNEEKDLIKILDDSNKIRLSEIDENFNDLVECFECGHLNKPGLNYCSNCNESLKERKLGYFETSSKKRPDVEVTNKSIILNHKSRNLLDRRKSGEISFYEWSKMDNISFKTKNKKLRMYFNYGFDNNPIKVKISIRHAWNFKRIYNTIRLTRELYKLNAYQYIENFVKIYRNKLMKLPLDKPTYDKYGESIDELQKLHYLLIQKNIELTYTDMAHLIRKEL